PGRQDHRVRPEVRGPRRRRGRGEADVREAARQHGDRGLPRGAGVRALALALLLTASGCAPKTEPPRPPLALDCGEGFEALSSAIAAEPGLKLADAPGEPYGFYNSADGALSFVVTRPGAPAHPAVLRQIAAGGRMETTGCAFGDKAAYEQLIAYVGSLAGAR